MSLLQHFCEQLSTKTHPQARLAKRPRLGGVEPLKFSTITTLAAVFSEAQGTQLSNNQKLSGFLVLGK